MLFSCPVLGRMLACIFSVQTVFKCYHYLLRISTKNTQRTRSCSSRGVCYSLVQLDQVLSLCIKEFQNSGQDSSTFEHFSDMACCRRGVVQESGSWRGAWGPHAGGGEGGGDEGSFSGWFRHLFCLTRPSACHGMTFPFPSDKIPLWTRLLQI